MKMNVLEAGGMLSTLSAHVVKKRPSNLLSDNHCGGIA